MLHSAKLCWSVIACTLSKAQDRAHVSFVVLREPCESFISLQKTPEQGTALEEIGIVESVPMPTPTYRPPVIRRSLLNQLLVIM